MTYANQNNGSAKQIGYILGLQATVKACRFVLFSHSAIIEGCNKWLKDNSGMVAWKCETIEHKVDVTADGNLTYDLDAMIRHDATFGYLVFVRGIRYTNTFESASASYFIYFA